MTQPIIGITSLAEPIGEQFRVLLADRIPLECQVIDGGPAFTAVPSVVGGNAFKLLRTALATATGDWNYLQPIGGGADDMPRIMAALRQGPVELSPGTFQGLSAQQLPNNCLLKMNAGTVFNNAVPVGGGGVTQALFNCGIAPTVAFGAVVTPAVFGSRQWLNSASIPVGTFVAYVNAGIQGGIYLVTHVDAAGGGNFTITVDRPILFNIPPGQSIFGFTANYVPTGIVIIGNKAQIVGPGGERAFEFLGARNSIVTDLIFDRQGGGTGDFDISLDTGCFNAHLIGVELYNGIGTGGIVIESGEQCSRQRCLVENQANVAGNAFGMIMLDSSVCFDDRECSTRNCQQGGTLSSDGENGCFACIVGGSYIGSTSVTGDGFVVTQGSSYCALVDMQVLYGKNFGFHTVNDTGVVVNTRMVNCHAHGNLRGIVLEATSFHVLDTVDVTGNLENGLFVANGALAQVTGLVSFDGNDQVTFVDGFGAAVFTDNGGTLVLSNSFIRNTTSPVAGWSGVRAGRVAGGTLATVTYLNVQIFQSAGSNTFLYDARGGGAGTNVFMSMTNCFGSGTGPNCVGVETGPSCALYLGIGNNVDAVTGTVLNVTGPFNEVTYNAPAPQTFPFPVRNGVSFESRITVRGGTPQPLQIVENVALGNFTVQGGAADTSTWKVKAI